jgi:hypothetical protein
MITLLGGASALLAPRPSAAIVQVNVGSANADVSGKANVDVTLVTAGATVVALQDDIVFDNTIVQLSSKVACRIAPAIGTVPDGCNQDPPEGPCKTLTGDLKQCGAEPQPSGCPDGAGANLSRYRGILAGTAVLNNNPILDGVLYTCTFTTVDTSRLPAELHITNIVASDAGVPPMQLPTTGSDGIIAMGVAPTPQPTSSETATPTSTPTAPPTSTPTNTATPTHTATPTPTPTLTRTPTATPCVGACHGGDAVTVTDVLTTVSIALGNAELSTCAPGDANHDDQITIDEILAAVHNALNGCGAAAS